MAISFVALTLRHERRIRCFFSEPVASAAFISTVYYTVTNVDGHALSPDVVAAIAVANSPNVVELQLGHDLVAGASYDVSAVGVPGTGTSTTQPPSTLRANFSQAPGGGGQPVASQAERILYGADVAFEAADWREDARGDLAEVAGLASLETDLRNMLASNGLPWAPDFGLQARRYVDGPGPAMAELRGRAESQARADDRVADATAAIVLPDAGADADDVASGSVELRVAPVGAFDVASKPIKVSVEVSA